MHDKKKVIHFTHWTRNGITALIDTIATANNSNIDFGFLLLTKDNDFEKFYNKIDNKLQLDFSKNPIIAIIKYLSFIKKYRPHIIHTHSFTPFMMAAFFSPRTKKILHLHSEYPYLYNKDIKSYTKRLLLKLCVSFSKATLITVSELAADMVKSALGKEAHYIPNGLPDEGSSRPAFTDRQNAFKFYSVSRLDHAKNIQAAIKIMVTLKENGFDVSYDIYGDGVEKSALLKLIMESEATTFIHLKGFHHRPQDLPEGYDFYLATTLQEGFGLSALDALRGNTPLITTPVGQIGISIIDNNTGFIINNKIDTDALSIKKILSMSNKDLSSIQLNGRNLYLNTFTKDIFLKNTFNLYGEILKFTD